MTPAAQRPAAGVFVQPVGKSESNVCMVSQAKDLAEDSQQPGYANNNEQTINSQSNCQQINPALNICKPQELQGDGRRREVKRNKIQFQVTNEEQILEMAIRSFQDSNPKITELENQLENLKL